MDFESSDYYWRLSAFHALRWEKLNACHLEPRQTAKDLSTASCVNQNNCGRRSGVDAITDAVAVRACARSLGVLRQPRDDTHLSLLNRHERVKVDKVAWAI